MPSFYLFAIDLSKNTEKKSLINFQLMMFANRIKKGKNMLSKRIENKITMNKMANKSVPLLKTYISKLI